MRSLLAGRVLKGIKELTPVDDSLAREELERSGPIAEGDKHQIEAALKRLAPGIHVVIATQKLSAEVISTNLRSNLPAQLALRVKSAAESRVIMDDSEAETLNGKGDAFLKTAAGLTRVQCAKVTEPEHGGAGSSIS